MVNNINVSEDEGVTIKSIILKHISKISALTCQEFTAGYWEKKPIKTQSGIFFSEVYHQDVRDAYCNAVDFLLDIVEPNADEPFNSKKEKMDKEEKEKYKDLKDNKNAWIKEKIKLRRRLFKEIFFLFKRIKYFDETDVYRDSARDDLIDEEEATDIGQDNSNLPKA